MSHQDTYTTRSQPLDRKIQFRVSEHFFNRFKQFCIVRRESVQTVCTVAVQKYMDSVESKEGRNA